MRASASLKKGDVLEPMAVRQNQIRCPAQEYPHLSLIVAALSKRRFSLSQ